jgi:hypothetical protein
MICPHCGLPSCRLNSGGRTVKDGYEEDDDPTATYIEAATYASCHRVIVTREDGEWYGDDFSITASQTIGPPIQADYNSRRATRTQDSISAMSRVHSWTVALSLSGTYWRA